MYLVCCINDEDPTAIAYTVSSTYAKAKTAVREMFCDDDVTDVWVSNIKEDSYILYDINSCDSCWSKGSVIFDHLKIF